MLRLRVAPLGASRSADMLQCTVGTVVLFTPRTAAGRRFAANQLAGWPQFGHATTVDQQAAVGLLQAMAAAGLTVQ